MNETIIETSFHVRLVGHRGTVKDEKYSETGLKLMNALWATVTERSITNRGLNHWVYLPSDEMFAGVEMSDSFQDSGPLERLDVTIPRYLRAVYIGPYSGLPQAWATLKTQLAERGERLGPIGLEIYGHCGPDPAKAETTILMGLQPKVC